jgi:uncharacterized RDD family membrane protein YckC
LSALVSFVVVPSALFAFAYFPLVTRLSLALVSPYTKADVVKRLFAAMIDGLVVLTVGVLYWNSGAVALLVVGALYLLMRDAVRGQSLGKALMGIVVISIDTGRPCTAKASIWRNILLVVPGVNVVTIFLEPVTIVRDPQGLRLGDRVAQTQVVEGLGAKDMAAAFQQWWRSLLLSPSRQFDKTSSRYPRRAG